MTTLRYTTDIAAGYEARFSSLNLQMARLREGVKYPIVSVLDYGVAGNGTTNDLIGIAASLGDLAKLGGGELFFPPGIYNVGQGAAGFLSIDIPSSNITISGVRGQTWIRHQAGIPSACAIMRVNRKRNVHIRNIGFDGNWGNPVVWVDKTMNGQALPQSTIAIRLPNDFASLAAMGWPSSGTFTLADDNGGQVITYTSLGATSFNGCTGGTGTLVTSQKIGRQDSQAGINHTTQATPQNHALQIRGCEDVVIENCIFRQVYGDAIWLAHDADNLQRGTRNTNIINCIVDVTARNCMTVTGLVEDVHVSKCWFMSPWTTAFDTEDCIARNIHIDSCYLDSWFNPAGHGNGINPLSIVGKSTSSPGPATWATGYRVTNCEIKGPIVIEAARDIVLRDCAVTIDWNTVSPSPIAVQFVSEGIILENVNVYDRGSSSGSGHEAAIMLQSGSAGTNQISEVTIRGGNIWAQNGRYGISVHGTGGRSGFAGTAVTVTATTLVDSGSPGWTTNAFVDQLVRCGNYVAEIVSNTANTLTLDRWTQDRGSPYGDPFPTPAAGAYEIMSSGLYVTVDDVRIDCSNRGYGNGGYGVWLRADNVGMRARVSRTIVRNATGPAFRIEPPGSPNTWRDIELIDNTAYDDQITPTCTSVVGFSSANLNQISRTTMRNNKNAGGIAASLTGLTAGVWLLGDGTTQQWQGFGAPSFTAPKGSTYQRVDGGAGTTLYVNETGTSTWRAV